MRFKYSQEKSETQTVIEPVVPRVCSIKEAQRRSITIDQFFRRLHAMVDDFYSFSPNYFCIRTFAY